MAGYLDDVVGGIGVRLGKVRRDDLVQTLVGCGLDQLAEVRAPGFQVMRQPQHRSGDLPRLGPERRTTPMPPRPGGVAMATMVSSRCMKHYRCPLFALRFSPETKID